LKKKERVQDRYSFDVDKLYEKSLESDYWKSCLKFYEDVRLTDMFWISEAQVRWLERIKEGLSE